MALPSPPSSDPKAIVMIRPVRSGLAVRGRLVQVLEFLMEIVAAAE